MTIAKGEIDTGAGLLIEPMLTEKVFLGSSVGMTASVFVKNGNICSYKLRNLNIEGKGFLPVLYFTNEALAEIHLHPVVNEERSWATYSLQSEMAHKLNDDNFLQKIIGTKPPYVFSWGVIESLLDEKNGTAYILVRYKKSGKK